MNKAPVGIEPTIFGLQDRRFTTKPRSLKLKIYKNALAGNRTRGYCLEGNNVTTTPPGLR
jgi:hypothetical protein